MTAVSVSTGRAQDLMRLGWAIAELRGRLYFGEKDPGRLVTSHLVRTDHALPLGTERSPAEQLIETRAVVRALAERTGLELSGAQIKDNEGKLPEGDQADSTAAERVLQLSRLPRQSDADWHKKWETFTEGLYQWDGDIQDYLGAASFGESSAYQLGRGLAECSWGLDPVPHRKASRVGLTCSAVSGALRSLACLNG